VLVSLPLTVVVSLVLVFVIQGKGSVEEAMSPYVSRFKDIQRTGDRTDFLKAGALIGSLHPILGGGADSFAWQFEREIESPRGSFPRRFVLPLHGSAHNVYAQTFSGKGVCGLLTLLAIPFTMLAAAPRVVRDSKRSVSEKLIVVTGACYGCAFLIYGNVQEVFYVQVLQFLFFAIVGIVAAVGYRASEIEGRNILVSPIICVGLLALHVGWEFGLPGHTRTFYGEKRPFGCFTAEAVPDGSVYRWCGERSVMERAIPSDSAAITITVEAGPVPQTLIFHDEGMPSGTVTLGAGEKRSIDVPVSGISQDRGYALIRLDASSSFVPKLLWPQSADTRRIAFKAYEAR
jgi:hypothetical protein